MRKVIILVNDPDEIKIGSEEPMSNKEITDIIRMAAELKGFKIEGHPKRQYDMIIGINFGVSVDISTHEFHLPDFVGDTLSSNIIEILRNTIPTVIMNKVIKEKRPDQELLEPINSLDEALEELGEILEKGGSQEVIEKLKQKIEFMDDETDNAELFEKMTE